MGVLELLEEIGKIAPVNAAVEIAFCEDRVRLRITYNNVILRKVWEKKFLELTNCAPASPEKMILESAKEMIALACENDQAG